MQQDEALLDDLHRTQSNLDYANRGANLVRELVDVVLGFPHQQVG
jgi:hypothetical protein